MDRKQANKSRLEVIIVCTLDGMSTKDTLDKLAEEFASGYGDASNMNLVRQARRIIAVMKTMGVIKG